ncbi:MAG: hypothetical protein IOC63_20280 [Methylobacterium sp.]|nr:hypothetical protein [Rhodocyclaceae bacterium]MCA3596223.1 hypothetical protein [Methylobacterium sp.]MCA3602606.1 hypothetical protein [Methylobacterium sp.]MCA3613441.1 hypothetical protein [Methylobacterium sp.]MCA3613676.1 hypothetical protein [Methylobacterium sp.]
MSVRHTGNRHDAKGRSTSAVADARFREMLGPPKDQAWGWMSREMMESRAYVGLSRAAMLCLTRLQLEHMAHAGRENGALIVTYEQFIEYGVAKNGITNAIRELEEAGFVRVMVRGGRSFGRLNMPSKYRLTWLPDFRGNHPTHEWQKQHKEYPDTPNRGHTTP